MRSKVGDKQRLEHILESINEIEAYTAALITETFLNTSVIRSASVFQLEIIGEAVNHLSTKLKDKHNNIDWNQIISVRNIIAHVYWGIDYTKVWETIKEDLPILKQTVITMMENLENEL